MKYETRWAYYYDPDKQHIKRYDDGWYIVENKDRLPETVDEIRIGPFSDEAEFVAKKGHRTSVYHTDNDGKIFIVDDYTE